MNNSSNHKQQPQNHDDIFAQYCTAMVELYGRIPLMKAFEIIQYLNDAQYSKDEFLDFVLREKKDRWKHGNPKHFFCFYSPDGIDKPENMEILSDCLEGVCFDDDTLHDMERYKELSENQKQHSYYIPSKEELLKYADDSYHPVLPEHQDLVDWVMNHKTELPFELTPEEIIAEVSLPLKMESDYSDAFGSLLKWLDMPEGEKSFTEASGELFDLISRVGYKTRMWFLCGYTPEEIGQ